MLTSHLRVDHVIIGVSDWESSNRFYRDVLGAELIPQGSSRSAYRLGDTQLNVHGPGVDLTSNVARLPVSLATATSVVWPGSIGEAVAHLQWRGVEIETGPVARLGANGEGTSFCFCDPDGSLLEFTRTNREAPARFCTRMRAFTEGSCRERALRLIKEIATRVSNEDERGSHQPEPFLR